MKDMKRRYKKHVLGGRAAHASDMSDMSDTSDFSGRPAITIIIKSTPF